MEPKARQIVPESTGAHITADAIGVDFVKPKPVTMSEIKPDPTTGRYTATKPSSGKQVDTKAVVAEIRADRAKDAEATKSAKKLVAENADEIARMRASRPSKKKKKEEYLSPYKQWRKNYLAAQNASKGK